MTYFVHFCTDIDECAVSPENCDPNAAYVDECALSTDNCDANAACTNTDGSFTCACNVGYSGDGVTCTDIDECVISSDNCDANAGCTNTVGSFICECNAGYSGDGVTCTDINECTSSTDNCDATATCTNTVGSFTCACITAGYSWNGTTCTVCIDYLGMTNNTIPDENIQASSELSSTYVASKGRLNGPSAWVAANGQTGPIWIQADIGYQTYVSGVITQGDGKPNYPDYVTSFSVSTFRTTGANEMFVEDQNGIAIIFPGNVDRDTEVTTIFSEPVYASIVRINCLTKHNYYYMLRFEILGCKQG
ncbi:uncharacterized protein [Amphiura filiformis]|uniref:uncharacterized protein n=1 Tax=Amphiura filiformis TaxID=82378 RepID=UPI003B21FADD